MKEKYTNLTDFINDIITAAEEASKDIISDFKKEETKEKPASVKKSKPEVKKEEPDIEKYKDADACYNIANIKNPCEETLKAMPGNITIDSFDHYILNEMVNGWPTYNEQHLIFEQCTEDGYKIPGITEAQLLAVLYNRYKNNSKKLDLVRQLMN